MSDIDAFREKFKKKEKEVIDIIEHQDLSNFDSKAEFDIMNINAPIFCYTNNTLVKYASQ